MKVTVRITQNFKTVAKPLLKKYHSLSKDLLILEKALIENPRLGTPLGQDAYKIRLKITSKGKGKSAGARVITLAEAIIVGDVKADSDELTVHLISIYDKSDTNTIRDKELKELINRIKKQK